MAESLKPPGQFFQLGVGKNPSETSRSWTKWLEQFEFYMTAAEKDQKPGKVQVATLLTLLGPAGQDVYRGFQLTEEERNDVTVVKQRFTNFFTPQVKEVFERFRFHSRLQQVEETFDEFVTSLRDLVATCNFSPQEEDKAIRDRIVMGLRVASIREDIFSLPEPVTLQQVLALCRRAEATKKYMTAMSSGQCREDVNEVGPVATSTGEEQGEVAAVSGPRPGATRGGGAADSGSRPGVRSTNGTAASEPWPGVRTRKPKDRRPGGTGQVKKCEFCALSHLRGQCPAYGSRCFACNNKGHFSRCCKRGQEMVQECTVDAESDGHAMFEVKSPSPREWTIKVSCEGKPISFKVDTGSSCNVLPLHVFKSLQSKATIQPTSQRLTSYSGHKLAVVGRVVLLTEHNFKYFPLEFVVVRGTSCTLLGLPSCSELGLVHVVHDITHSIAREYASVFEGLGSLPCKYSLRLKDGCTPVVHSPRRVPFRLHDQLKTTLNDMEKSGTICKVREATDWVHPIVTVLKPNGDLRVCLDPSDLNKNIMREHYALPTTAEIFAKLSQATVFSTLDATSGFLQLQLDEESSKLTTFATPFGRYRFLRLPYGISSAPEVFHRTVSEIFEDLPGVETYIDDILVHGRTKDEHDERLRAVLKRCQEVNFRLNRNKCKFEQDSIKYLGHVICQGKIQADPEKIKAIVDMPIPENKDDVRRLLGMATYLGKFCPELSTVSAPLRELMKKNCEWLWTGSHQQALEDLKHLVCRAPALKMFDPSQAATLSVDASKHGVGATILQHGQPVEFASAAFTETQQRYSQIEKEFLAVQFGLTRFHQYVYGQHVVVETDHKPLLGILRKNINDLSPRLLRMRLRNQLYDYTLVYKPGAELYVADTLSRAHVDDKCPGAGECERLDFEQVHAVSSGILPSDSMRDKVAQQTANDPVMKTLKIYIEDGWPTTKGACHNAVKPYWSVRADLITFQGLILRGSQIVIPAGLRKFFLSEVHRGHLGIIKCIQRAKNAIFWPGYVAHVRDMVESCGICQEHARNQAQQPLQQFELPEYPMQSIAVDLFQHQGIDYLVAVDRYSKWVDCWNLDYTTSRAVIDVLRRFFVDFGRPETLLSDNGPQFSSYEFKCFMEDQDVKHVTSSPHFAQSNGLAERMVQTVKNSLSKALLSGQNLSDVLSALRNTPAEDGLPSPAVLLQGRNLRGPLHRYSFQLQPVVVNKQDVQNILIARQGKASFYGKHSDPLVSLAIGQSVWCRIGHRKWVRALVIRRGGTPSSYVVQLDSGQVLRRNRSFLRPLKSSPSTPSTAAGLPSGSTLITQSRNDSQADGSVQDDYVAPSSPQKRIESRVENPVSSPSPEARDLDSSGVDQGEGRYMTRYGREVRKPKRYGDGESGE